MKRKFLPLILTALIAIPGCSAIPEQELYNSGRFRVFVNKTAGITSGLTLYMRGRALYELDRYREAAVVLTKAATEGAWKDAALFYLGQALAASEKKAAALRVFTRLVEKGRSAVFTRRALYRAAAIALKMKQWTTLTALCKTGLGRIPSSGFFLSRALTAAEKSGNRKALRMYAFRTLGQKRYGRLNRRALKGIRKTVSDTRRLPFSRRLLWIEGIIRAGQHGRAIRLLKSTRCGNSTRRQERDLNLVWCYRLLRQYSKAAALLRKLGKNSDGDRKLKRRILDHRCRLAARRGRLSTAFRLLKRAESLYSGKNASTARYLSLRAGYSAFGQRINFWAARLYPNFRHFGNTITKIIIRYYSRRKYRTVLSLARTAVKTITNKNLLGKISFFAAVGAIRTGQRAEAARYAALVIQNSPYSYYHRELTVALPGLRGPNRSSVSDATTAPELTLKLLVNGKKGSEARSKLSALWEKDPLNRALNNRNTPLAGLLAKSDRALFNNLTASGYHKDAFLLLYRSLRDANRTFGSLAVPQLAAAAALCRRAGAYRSQFACLVNLFRNTGWGLEVIRMHSLTGAIPVVEKLYPKLFKKPVLRWSARKALDPLFVLSLIRQESAFQHRVTSWAGARGLMQVMPYTAMNIIASRRTPSVDLLQPEQNIQIGSSFLGWLKKAYKTDIAVLIGYNAGPNRIRSWKNRYRRLYGKFDRWGFVESIPFRETRGYIKVVLSNLMVYRMLYN